MPLRMHSADFWPSPTHCRRLTQAQRCPSTATDRSASFAGPLIGSSSRDRPPERLFQDDPECNSTFLHPLLLGQCLGLQGPPPASTFRLPLGKQVLMVPGEGIMRRPDESSARPGCGGGDTRGRLCHGVTGDKESAGRVPK